MSIANSLNDSFYISLNGLAATSSAVRVEIAFFFDFIPSNNNAVICPIDYPSPGNATL